jgi:hypothetical protein
MGLVSQVPMKERWIEESNTTPTGEILDPEWKLQIVYDPILPVSGQSNVRRAIGRGKERPRCGLEVATPDIAIAASRVAASTDAKERERFLGGAATKTSISAPLSSERFLDNEDVVTRTCFVRTNETMR